MFTKNKSGYGYVKYIDKVQIAHRVSYKISNPLENIDGLDILHSCDNPSCCNPEHLSVGTHLDNMNDMAVKERANKKLSIDLVNELIEHFNNSKTSMRKLAKKYGISHQMISLILANKRRKIRN